ncbi:MAG: hypothetical protein WCV90_05200 [Candidatus Woesearchaeota archaeon]|jgi:hypothetical protein
MNRLLQEVDILDQERIKRAYESNPHPSLEQTADEFLFSMAFRVYTEYCLHSPVDFHASYQGSEFKQFLDQETHYTLERAGFKWLPSEGFNLKTGSPVISGRFENLTSEQYQEVREQVIDAWVRYSIDYFTEFKKGLPNRNIRTSLKDLVQ